MKLSLRFFIPLVGITAISVSTLAADMMSHSGHARSRMELNKNTGGTTNDWQEYWLNRVRLNVDISPSKTLMVRLTPQVAYVYGNTATGAAAGNPATLAAQEAWMSWTASDMVSLYVGRQIWNFGKGLIIGSNEWGGPAGQVANFFDAARVRLTYDMGTTDLFYAKVSETLTVAAASETADHDLTGFYTQLNPDMGAVKNVDLYALWNDNRLHVAGGANGHTSRMATLGLRADGDIHVVDYNAEFTAQFGSLAGVDQKGYQTSLQAGAKLADVHHIGLGLDYANSEFRNQFPSGHEQLGKADIISRNNLMAISLMTAWKLHDKWKANIDGYYFMAAKDDNGTAGGVVATNGKRALGMEGDIALAYMAEKNLTFDFGYNVFKGGAALEAANMDKVNSGLFAQGTLTF